MTEDDWIAEWLTSEDIEFLLDFLGQRVSPGERRLRLFALACSRLVWTMLDLESQQAIEVAEGFVEGIADGDSLRQANNGRQRAVTNAWPQRTHSRMSALACSMPSLAGHVTRQPFDEAYAADSQIAAVIVAIDHAIPDNSRDTSAGDQIYEATRAEVTAQEIQRFRDIFGNPFRPVAIDSAWLTWQDQTIVKLARAAYDERALPSGHLDRARLAIVADALEEAGCTSDDMLAHLRGPGPHVRGCWVVDLLLGKE